MNFGLRTLDLDGAEHCWADGGELSLPWDDETNRPYRRRVVKLLVWRSVLCIVALEICATPGRSQTLPPATGLSQTEGADAGSGIRWIRIAQAADKRAAATGSASDDGPRLTVQCSELSQKRRVDLYVDFGGADRTFHAPPLPDPVTHFPPHNPSASLKMDFPGYRAFKRNWEAMPSGEYRYRLPSFDSGNMEPVSFFLQCLSSVPDVRVSFADRKAAAKEAEFRTAALMNAVHMAPLCQP
jgi:hypothetical protein